MRPTDHPILTIKTLLNEAQKKHYLRSNKCEKMRACLTIDVPAKADIKLASLNCCTVG